MHLSLKINKHFKAAPARHRLTIVCGQSEMPVGHNEVYRVDIPVEVQKDHFGEYLVIPDNAFMNLLGETKKIDYVEVRLRSTGEAVVRTFDA